MKEFYEHAHLLGVNVKFKNKSRLMKLLSVILFFVDFKDYTTVLGNTIYYPSKEYVENNIVNSMIVAIHEAIHIHDAKVHGQFIFMFQYLFPQILFLIFIPFSFFSYWFLLSFLFFLPLPAYFRRNLEVRGYIASLIGHNEAYKLMGNDIDERRDRLNKLCNKLNKEFSGSAYYYMWPFGFKLQKYVEDVLHERLNDSIFLVVMYQIRHSLSKFKDSVNL